MTLDEFEALRLADHEGLYQERAAELMGVSRPTLGRILESARRKVAEALVGGKILRIEGGPVHQPEACDLVCEACAREYHLAEHVQATDCCPNCGNERLVFRPGPSPGSCGPGRRCRQAKAGAGGPGRR